MLQSILKQIWNRKQNNTWIIVELILVFCLIWYMADYFFVLTYNYSIPNHRNIDHTFYIDVSKYTSDNPEYNKEYDNPETKESDLKHIIQIIRSYPGITAISVSFLGSILERGSLSGDFCRNPDDSTLEILGQVIYMDTNTDYFSVFGCTTDNGKKPVSVHDFDWSEPNSIIITRITEQALFPDGSSAIGKKVEIGDEIHKVIGVVDNIKRFSFERPAHTLYKPETLTDNTSFAEITVRINPTVPDPVFKEKFENEMGNKLETGNFYLKEICSLKETVYNTATGIGKINEIKIRIYLILFFLVNIILCVVGTFWYRVNMRKDEIGLRKALGSSSANIRNNLLTEGICLLICAAFFAMIIEYQFVRAGLIFTPRSMYENKSVIYLPDHVHLRFLITNAITFVIMAIVVTAAIWLPARKAAAMEAATALHYE